MTDTNNRYDRNLVSVLAHDLRTPLSSARGFIDLAINAGPLDAKQQMFLERALVALSRMETMISDVLEMSRSGQDVPLKLEPCRMDLLVAEAVALIEGYAAQRNVTISTEFAENLKSVAGEVGFLQQIVYNLITNAVKYNLDGGHVFIHLQSDDEWFKLVIRDTGVGIPQADLDRVFEPFFRSRMNANADVDGTGLGLAIVHSLVERHGGKISVNSVPNEGSEFVVLLPVSDETS